MSYADMAAKGPKQTDEEVPEIMHEDSGVHSLDSISDTHVNSVPSYADQQLEAERAEEAAEETADKAEKEAKDFGKKAQSSAKKFEREAKDTYEKVKKEAGIEGKKAKQGAKDAEQWAEKNKGNPVVLGNVVAVAALGGLLGFGAYRKHVAGELTWKVAGAWAGVVGLFAVGDYYVSQWLFKNRYPPKN